MGLNKSALRFLVREHKRKPFSGPVLCLGRPGIFATFDEARAIVLSEEVAPADCTGLDVSTNIPSWKGTWNERFTSDVAFFKMLGLSEVRAADYSDYEKPDWLLDLNEPVPPELHDRFPLIIDSGTMEHVFDVRQCLMNIVLMLKAGGRIVSLAPANNYVNHGFYQFGPTLFLDFFGANGFVDMRCFLVAESRYLDRWDLYEVTGTEQQGNFMSKERLGVLFAGEKTQRSTADKIPLQGIYKKIHSSGGDTSTFQVRADSFAYRLRMRVPKGLELFCRRYILAYDPSNRLPRWLRILMIRWIPGFDKSRQTWIRCQKPWGLKLSASLE